MKRVVEWIQGFALAMGGPGLFIIAFLDSSFLSLPEINDLLIVWMVTRHKERMLYYALMATAGSLTGCLVLYFIGRKGGDAVLRRRFHERHIDRAIAAAQRHGILTVLIPSILPPPAPFKIFVLLAGVARISVVQFTIAIAVGRGARYLIEGLLAVLYGERAARYVRENTLEASLIAVGVIAVAGVGYSLWKRRRRSA